MKAQFEKISLKLFIMKRFLKIRDIIGSGPIWVSVDETTDVNGRYIANVIILKLSSVPSKPFFINFGKLNKCNHQTIVRF